MTAPCVQQRRKQYYRITFYGDLHRLAARDGNLDIHQPVAANGSALMSGETELFAVVGHEAVLHQIGA